MEENKSISNKILERAKKIYELSKAKDIIKWYYNQKISWFERQIKNSKQKRNKRIEKEIMKRTAVTWNKLKIYEQSLQTKHDKLIFVKTKDGRIVLLDNNDSICSEKE